MLKNYPFYFKSTVIMLGLVLFVYILLNLREIFVPLAFALLLSILLNPVVNFFNNKWKIPNAVSISIALLLATILIVAIGYFIFSQVASFADEFPTLKKKSVALLEKLQQFLSERFNINTQKQSQLLNEAGAAMKPMVGQTLGTVAGTLGMVLLLPVYSFCFLYYKKLVLNFLFEIFSEKNSSQVAEILSEIKAAVQNYMVGLLLEAVVVAALNTAALLILDVQYALLLGVLGALLNVLPYIGGIIAIALPLIIATITKDGFSTQIGVTVAYLVIQFVDNHFLVPFLVSSKVKINALISIVIVLMGGALWGIPGMFLSIPFIGALKIIFDHLPELKPWGKLLGDEVPTRHKGQIWNRRRKTAARSTEVKAQG